MVVAIRPGTRRYTWGGGGRMKEVSLKAFNGEVDGKLDLNPELGEGVLAGNRNLLFRNMEMKESSRKTSI